MVGLVHVNNLEVVDGVSVAGADVKAGEVLLHVPALVTGPGRGGVFLLLFSRSAEHVLTSVCMCYRTARLHHVSRGCGWGVLL